MLRIRLRRQGKKKQPTYRIVVADSRAPRDGAFVETIGTYQPLDRPSAIILDEERARHWLERGAQPSDRVSKILAIQGIAEIPSKLQTRIELGKKRAEEAQNKPKEDASPTAEAPASTPASAAIEPETSTEPEPASEEAPTGDAKVAQDAPAATESEQE